MRIIGGKYRSRPLLAPKGMTTRPTLDQVREALFNILQGRTEGIDVLDLYGGSGAVALEALSRGANHATICDQSRQAVDVIRKNAESLRCMEQVTLLPMKDTRALDQLCLKRLSFDLIYLDPPYEQDPTPVLQRIADEGLLRPGGRAVWEHIAARAPGEIPGLTFLFTRKYRDTCLTFYERPMGPEEETNDDPAGRLPLSGEL